MTSQEAADQGIISIWGVSPEVAGKFMANQGHGSLSVEEGTGVALLAAIPFANAIELPTTNPDTIESLPLAMDGLVVCTQNKRGRGEDGGSSLRVAYYPPNSRTFEGTYPALTESVMKLAGALGVKIIATSPDTITSRSKVTY